MRAAWIVVAICVFGCERPSASATPDDATTSSSDAATAPSSGPEDGEEAQASKQVTLEIEGGLTEAQVQKVVDDHFAEIKECFDLALAEPDGVELLEPIVVHLQVDAGGKVAQSELDHSGFGHAGAEACIVEQAGTWTFPAPKGNKSAGLRIPFLLRSY